MRKIVSARPRDPLAKAVPAEPNPLFALAVGLVYVFRTAPGHRILRQLEDAVLRYARDPHALWQLVTRGEEIIDTTAHPIVELPPSAGKAKDAQPGDGEAGERG